MATLAEDIEVKTSAEGAQSFIDWYYVSASERKPLSSFYVNSSARYGEANVKADISVNGLLVKDVEELEGLLSTQANGSRVKYEIEGFDAHVLNPSFLVGCPDHLLPKANGAGAGGSNGRSSARDRSDRDSKISTLVTVTGNVVYGTDKDSPRKPFTDIFVLVPNWDSMGPKAPRNAKRFLVMSQNYRAF